MAKKPKTKTLWGKIKAEYITGEISCRDLAEKYEISESAIFRHCNKEGWVEARAAYRSKVTAEAIACAQARAIQETSEVYDVAKTIVGDIRLALGDPNQFYKRLVEDGSGELTERVFSKIDSKAVKELASAVKELHPVIAAFDNPAARERNANLEDLL